MALGECSDARQVTYTSLWPNFIARVMKETKVEEHFTEHDLRAKCVSCWLTPTAKSPSGCTGAGQKWSSRCANLKQARTALAAVKAK